MTALPVLDHLLGQPVRGSSNLRNAEVQRLSRWASSLAEELLAEIRHLRALDEDVPDGDDPDRDGLFADDQFRQLLLDAHRDWVRRAELYFDRIPHIQKRGASIAQLAELGTAYARTKAMMNAIGDGTEPTKETDTLIPIAEVRRALRARLPS